jgi:PKD repeat protein
MFTVGTVTSWSWSFGDGTGSSIQNPQHTFATAGLHIVCLTIATDSGCTSVICDSVYVGSNTGNCTSNFTYQASGLILSFTGYSSSNYPATWTWDFGDSTGTITGINNAVTHTYAAQGYYTVCLTTLDSTGCTDTYCQTIYVGSNVFNSLCGTVSAGGALLDHGLATLYTIDTTSGTATWYQTVVLDSSSHYCFLNIPNGTYIVLAAPDSNSSVFNLYFPTYYGDVLNWGDATVIVVPGNPAPGWDINLIGFNTPSPGNGNIGGGLFLGGAKGIGDAVPGVTVLLYDASLDALISTVSDDNGLFIFSNLAYGTYTVYPEIPGLNTIPAVVILNSTNPDADNLYFSVNSDQIVAGMEQQDAQITSVSDVYPNPANANSGIAVVLQKPAQLNVTVLDITGRKLSEKNLRMAVGNHFINVNAEKLTSGVYQIILTSDDGNRIIRQFVK